uniref:Gustatory receptor 68a-like n=1 Tax=Diabrotica virgifera virgifera TaxID=50390 RepID=A0A6P7F898_DIAVI
MWARSFIPLFADVALGCGQGLAQRFFTPGFRLALHWELARRFLVGFGLIDGADGVFFRSGLQVEEIVEITTSIKKRLVEIYKLTEVVNHKGARHQKKSVYVINNVMELYKDIFFTIEIFNKFFGNLLFMRLTVNLLTILACFEFILYSITAQSYVGFYFLALFSSLIFQMCFVVRCIISCENVEKAGEKLGTLCKILQSEVQEPRLKEQLIDMSTLIAALPLSFSISGFFKINKRLIPSLISGITSYLIILIQFKAQDQCS